MSLQKVLNVPQCSIWLMRPCGSALRRAPMAYLALHFPLRFDRTNPSNFYNSPLPTQCQQPSPSLTSFWLSTQYVIASRYATSSPAEGSTSNGQSYSCRISGAQSNYLGQALFATRNLTRSSKTNAGSDRYPSTLNTSKKDSIWTSSPPSKNWSLVMGTLNAED